MTKWGIVSTIKAPLNQIARFAAHHLDQGAHRIFIYLDDGTPDMHAALNQHPKLRVTLCDDRYWKNRKRPEKHQPRQTMNAAHAYGRAGDVDWLTHIDVDEFLLPATADAPDFATQLSALPASATCARLRPRESLANPDNTPPHLFKSCAINRKTREKQTAQIYPAWGAAMNGGFLSHVQGKMAYRTGLPDLHARIHNVYVGDTENPGQQELPDMALLHFHAPDYTSFFKHFAYRHAQGSYRAELKPNRPESDGGLSAHQLFARIMSEGGEPLLRQFFTEVCTATPALTSALQKHGHLHQHHITPDHSAKRHFPLIA
ncbi:MAG: glycosyltransferase family 2 protein [Paracoccaceae bacterium]